MKEGTNGEERGKGSDGGVLGKDVAERETLSVFVVVEDGEKGVDKVKDKLFGLLGRGGRKRGRIPR